MGIRIVLFNIKIKVHKKAFIIINKIYRKFNKEDDSLLERWREYHSMSMQLLIIDRERFRDEYCIG